MANSSISRASSGITGLDTASDTAITLISHANMPAGATCAIITNTSAIAGFYSLDGGNTWEYLPANFLVPTEPAEAALYSVLVKRIASGSNLTGLYASVWK